VITAKEVTAKESSWESHIRLHQEKAATDYRCETCSNLNDRGLHEEVIVAIPVKAG
jgi:hypothetical protein